MYAIILVGIILGVFVPTVGLLVLSGCLAVLGIFFYISCTRNDYSGDGGLAAFGISLIITGLLAVTWLSHLITWLIRRY